MVPLGINNAGQIVGAYSDRSGTHGFLLDVNGSYTTLDVPGAIATDPFGINDVGQIVGNYWYPVPEANHGFLATPGAKA